ncbi:FeoA family protein [Bacillus smithii]|uniref:FeoA family protein n=1 Tax=Bacillus smithii TaxID=1479 RepID=UPI0030CA08E9
MTLTELKEGESAYITTLEGVQQLVKKRLLHIGLDEGSYVTLRRILPIGGPCLLECSGQMIGIRRKDARKIKVKKI